MHQHQTTVDQPGQPRVSILFRTGVAVISIDEEDLDAPLHPGRGFARSHHERPDHIVDSGSPNVLGELVERLRRRILMRVDVRIDSEDPLTSQPGPVRQPDGRTPLPGSDLYYRTPAGTAGGRVEQRLALLFVQPSIDSRRGRPCTPPCFLCCMAPNGHCGFANPRLDGSLWDLGLVARRSGEFAKIFSPAEHHEKVAWLHGRFRLRIELHLPIGALNGDDDNTKPLPQRRV